MIGNFNQHYTMIENFDGLKVLLSTPHNIAITTHQNPDGDAMGSSLALYHYLLKLGHTVHFIAPTPYAEFLRWMPGNSKVIIYNYNTGEAKRVAEQAEIFFCLDFNAPHRAGDVSALIEASTATKVCIDHHPQPSDFADYLYSRTSASSTAEMIYDFMEYMGDLDKLDEAIGSCIYTGILTDTGGFQFPMTSSRVHKIVAHCIDAGVNNSQVYHTVFNSFTENRMRLLGHCIEKMKIYPEYNAALIALDRDELLRFQVKTGDTEGIVNYPLKIKGINFSAFIVDRTELIKISFRSVGSFDVNQFSRNHFKGGGHTNAAGGASHDTLFNTIKKFEEALPSYKDQLDY